MKAKKSIDGIIFYFDQSAAMKVDYILNRLSKRKPAPSVELEAADYFLDVLRNGQKVIEIQDLQGLYSIAQ